MTTTSGKVTIYDVAARAGVAISTVSRVINGSKDVSDPTRERVRQAIDHLHFRPQRTAKSLAQQQQGFLALAVSTFTTPFHNELLKGVRDALRRDGRDLLLFDLGSENPRRTLLDFLQRGAVDGLLLAGLPVDDVLARELQALQAPVVLVGSEHPDFDAWCWDDIAGGRAATEHLLEEGHRRIAVIRAHTESLFQDHRIEGYRAALSGAGLPFDADLVVAGETAKHGGFSEEAGFEAAQRLLRQPARATAVVACSDVQAVGAWKAIRDAGLRVPQDVALVGYDDVKASYYQDLSSVDQHAPAVGAEATEVLLRRRAGALQEAPRRRLVTPTLRVRASSRWPATVG